jgi:hypothetical protein
MPLQLLSLLSYSDNVLMNCLTVDELRARMNLSPLSDNDKKNLAIVVAKGEEKTAAVSKPKEEPTK